MIELDFLELFLFDHKLNGLFFKLLPEALVLLLQVLLHFFLLSGEQLVDFELAVEFLFKVFNHEAH